MVDSDGQETYELRRPGARNAAIAKARLFQAIWPTETGSPAMSQVSQTILPQLGDAVPSDRQNKLWRSLSKRLEKGRRWADLEQRFGMGFLALVPSSTVPHSWIERLSIDHFTVWMDMVNRFNMRAVEFGRLIIHPMKDALHGRQAPSRLVLEEITEDMWASIGYRDLALLLKPSMD
jgi:hypothetical protein